METLPCEIVLLIFEFCQSNSYQGLLRLAASSSYLQTIYTSNSRTFLLKELGEEFKGEQASLLNAAKFLGNFQSFEFLDMGVAKYTKPAAIRKINEQLSIMELTAPRIIGTIGAQRKIRRLANRRGNCFRNLCTCKYCNRVPTIFAMMAVYTFAFFTPWLRRRHNSYSLAVARDALLPISDNKYERDETFRVLGKEALSIQSGLRSVMLETINACPTEQRGLLGIPTYTRWDAEKDFLNFCEVRFYNNNSYDFWTVFEMYRQGKTMRTWDSKANAMISTWLRKTAKQFEKAGKPKTMAFIRTQYL